MGEALLKFLSGSQNGAEAALERGDYVLGSGDGADLFLSDAAVMEEHARLAIGEKEWTVEPLEGAEVRVGGSPVPPGASVLAPFSVMTLGGVHIAIGPDAAWPSLPAIPGPVDNPAPGTSAAEAAPTGEAAPANAPGSAAETPETGSPEESAAAPQRRSKLPFLLLPIFLIAAAATALGGWRHVPALSSWFAPSLADKTAEALRLRGDAVEYPASGATPPGVIAVGEGRDGAVELSGLVMTNQERDAILAAAGFDAALFSQDIKTVDGELEKAGAALRAAYPMTELTRGDQSFSARLSGLVPRIGDSGEAFRLVRDALDDRIAIRRSLVAWVTLREEAERTIRGLGASAARFVMEEDRAVLEAPEWPDRNTRLETLRRLEERYGGMGSRMFGKTLKSDSPEREGEPQPARTVQIQPLPFDIPASFLSTAAAPPLPELPAAFVAPQPVAPGPASGESERPAPAAQAEAEPESEPEPQTEPDPVAEAEAEAEPGSEGEPEPEGEPGPPEPPPPPQWHVLSLVVDGFIDQNGVHHRVGELLGETLRIVDVWAGGVVLQQGEKTIFVTRNSVAIEK